MILRSLVVIVYLEPPKELNFREGDKIKFLIAIQLSNEFLTNVLLTILLFLIMLKLRYKVNL